MKRVVRYTTSDGKVFSSTDEAEKYLDRLYGENLTEIARKLVQIDKYGEMVKTLDTLITSGAFTTLSALLEDREIQDDEDYDNGL